MAANVQHFSDDGATILSAYTWPDAVAGLTQTPRKFGFESVSDRPLNNVQIATQQVGLSDGITQLVIALDNVTLSAPWGVTATVGLIGSGGTWLSIGTKGFIITALNANGETVGSNEVSVTISDATQAVTLTWQPVVNATLYKVYDTDTPGSYPAVSLRATLPAITTYVDKGGARTTGVPASINTTAGWFSPAALGATNSGGVWGATGTRFWRVSAVDSTTNGQILAASIETSLNVDGTNKKIVLSWASVPGAAQYNVYRSNLAGSYPSPSLVGTTTGLTLDDVGNATIAGTLTATPTYGVPPAAGAFGAGPLLAGGSTVAVGQQIFYWVNRVVPISTPEAGNIRVASIIIKET